MRIKLPTRTRRHPLVCRYINAHKKWRHAYVLTSYVSAVIALFVTHEWWVHFTLATSTFSWDALVMRVEEAEKSVRDAL